MVLLNSHYIIPSVETKGQFGKVNLAMLIIRHVANNRRLFIQLVVTSLSSSLCWHTVNAYEYALDFSSLEYWAKHVLLFGEDKCIQYIIKLM